MHAADTESLYTVGKSALPVPLPSDLPIAHGFLTEQGKCFSCKMGHKHFMSSRILRKGKKNKIML